MSSNVKKTLHTVKLIKDGLTHQGVERKSGETIDVSGRQREFLAGKGFIVNSAAPSTQAAPGVTAAKHGTTEK